MTPVPIVALDFAAADDAMAMVELLGDSCRFYKVGSELFTAAGPAVVRRLRGRGCNVMLDLKFHDIPNTVRGAVLSARELGVKLLTVHALGGSQMIGTAVEAAAREMEIFAVTILTSHDAAGAAELLGRSVTVAEEVVRLARMAQSAGASGVVASAAELEVIRGTLGPELQVLVPGVRLAGTDVGDQARVVTPAEAARGGAAYVVLGRTVTQAADPRRAMDRAVQEMSSS